MNVVQIPDLRATKIILNNFKMHNHFCFRTNDTET